MRAPGAGLSIRCCGGSTVYRITHVRRVVSPPSFPPFALSSLLVFPPTSLPLYLSLSPWKAISPTCILPKYLDCYRCIGRNERRPRPITRQPPLPFLGKAKRKQIMAQSSRELQASLILPHPEFFDLFYTHLNPRNLN